MRGSFVIARCYGGVPAVLRVWGSERNMIYLSEETQFQQLSTGCTALLPVGFPIEDVFIYDPQVAEHIANGSLDWSSLRRFEALSRQS